MEDPILSYDQIIKLDTADMLIELKRKLQNKLQITAAGQPPNILDYYKKHAAFVDDEDLKNEGTEVYVIVSNHLVKLNYAIIAFKTSPVGYAGFNRGLCYEKEIETLFIGVGTLVKTYRLTDIKFIFQKDHGMGFWGWTKYKDFILQQEEIGFGVFNLKGEQLWETYVSPPYVFEINEDKITLKFDDIIETRLLHTPIFTLPNFDI